MAKKESKVDSIAFAKSQLLKSTKYQNRRDLVNALLDDNKKYTIEEVDTLIDEFMKGQVN